MKIIWECVIHGKTLKCGFLRWVRVRVCLGSICPGIWSYSPLDSWAKESYVVPGLNDIAFKSLLSISLRSFPSPSCRVTSVGSCIFQNLHYCWYLLLDCGLVYIFLCHWIQLEWKHDMDLLKSSTVGGVMRKLVNTRSRAVWPFCYVGLPATHLQFKINSFEF